jgi:signal transduction histidine kinase
MIDLPFISLDMFQSAILNITIITTLVLLYHIIPTDLLSRSKLGYSLCLGAIFGFTAAISMPNLWQTTGAPAIGLNLILVPLAGFIGGPVSAVVVAAVLLLGSMASTGSVSSLDILNIMSAVLVGALFYSARSWKRFPSSYLVRFFLIGMGVVLIEIFSQDLGTFLQVSHGLQAGTPPPMSQPGLPPLISQPGLPPLIAQPVSFSLLSMLPFFILIVGGTILIGSIIVFIDRKKLAEKELLDYKGHLEELVMERTTDLRYANSLQKATIESTADGIVVVDREGMIWAYNAKASEILNLPADPSPDPQEAMVYLDHIVASLSDPEEFVRLVVSLPDSAEKIVTTDLKFVNGRIYELSVNPQWIDDRFVGRVWSLHDITDRKHAEEALTAAHNKLVLLSSITRHDIMNQMTALGAYVELVREKTRDPAGSSHLDTMGKILEVIRLQLEFTRDYQDVGVQAPVWQNIKNGFSKAAESFAGKNLEFRCDTGNTEIYADPLIERAFYNLIDNSIRHGERVSEITLSAEKADPDLLLVYEDNGAGVLPEEKEKIFLKGFGKHTGLGMFLIKEILSITGITIRENGIPGQGVRFEIRVPSGKFRFP